MTGQRFVPVPTPDTAAYWTAASQGRLELPECPDCGPFFYPRSYCPRCGSRVSQWREMSGRARLLSYVVNYRPAPGFEGDGPYVIAVVELVEGPRMLSNLVEVEGDDLLTLPLDLPLVVRFEARGEWAVPVFAPERSAR